MIEILYSEKKYDRKREMPHYVKVYAILIMQIGSLITTTRTKQQNPQTQPTKRSNKKNPKPKHQEQNPQNSDTAKNNELWKPAHA